MRIEVLIISLCVISGTSSKVYASEKKEILFSSEKKHSINISVSDGLTLSIANFLGIGLSDVITNVDHYDLKTSGVIGIGYRYSISRFKVGGDLGFVNITSKIKDSENKNFFIKEKEQNFLILPTVEYFYYKNRIIEIYGSVSSGVDIIRSSECKINESKKTIPSTSSLTTRFAYQVNPIGVKLGNEFIGGFVEVGIGYKGFLTAGISLKF